MENLFLIDGLNNNKVVGEFYSQEEVNSYLDAKEFVENWENVSETFEEFKDEFFTVTSDEMNEAIHKFGSRMKNYWT